MRERFSRILRAVRLNPKELKIALYKFRYFLKFYSFLDLDIFQLRLEFCEDKMNNCIEAIQRREQSKGYEGRFSHSTFAPCQIILQDCVKAQIGN